MKKKELLQMADWEASDEIKELAFAEQPKMEKGYYGTREIYNTELFMQVKMERTIMAVYFYLTEELRRNVKEPVYILFIEQDSDFFLTYDMVYKKWRTATLTRLGWKKYISSEKVYSSIQDKKLIQEFIKEENGYNGIICYQYKIRDKQCKERHKRETDPWDAVMEKVPPLPKDWKQWASKTAETEHFIFYQYAKRVTEGYCTWCGKMVPITNPRYNKEARCKCCGHVIHYKSLGKAGNFDTADKCAYLLQRFDDKIILREFGLRTIYRKGEYPNGETHCFEQRRIILNDALEGEAYYWGLYKQVNCRWIKSDVSWTQSCNYWLCEGMVYLRNLPGLSKTGLKKTGLYELTKRVRLLDPERYLIYRKKYPYLEQLSKAGLAVLVKDIMKHESIHIKEGEKKLSKTLMIDDRLLKQLRERQGGVQYLHWLQTEKLLNIHMTDELITWYIQHDIKPDDLKFIQDRMSFVQIRNYLLRQQSNGKDAFRTIITTWRDYLSMAEKLGMDTQDEIVYRVSHLNKRHKDMVKLMEQKDFEEQIKNLEQKFPRINVICDEIRPKYEYLEDKEYAVLVPENIRQIVQEGKNLHHCVVGQDRYYDRINREEAYILFLRKKDDLQKSYYTLEVEPGGTIRQKRTMYNRQNSDIEDAKKFLQKWQRVVKKRMTAVDCRLAECSKELRNKELLEMRQNRVIIHGGEQTGTLLADVLQEDLMENTSIELSLAA